MVWEGRGFKCVRESAVRASAVEHIQHKPSREPAVCENPARECRVKWKICASPGGTTPVLTHTLQGAPFQTGPTTRAGFSKTYPYRLHQEEEEREPENRLPSDL